MARRTSAGSRKSRARRAKAKSRRRSSSRSSSSSPSRSSSSSSRSSSSKSSSKSREQQIKEIMDKAKSISESINTIARAKSSGMSVSSKTSVKDAEEYLKRNNEVPTDVSGEVLDEGTDDENIDTGDDKGKDKNKDKIDDSALKNTKYYKDLPPDEQEAVKAIFFAIANNDQEMADRLANAFEASAKIAGPFFKQQLRLAKDELKRGFVEIDKEKVYKEQAALKRLQDLREDVSTQKEFLSLEETSSLKAIEREYEQEVKSVRQDLAATGFSSSSRRAETEEILDEATGDLREGTRRRFGMKKLELDNTLTRNERDTQDEVERLTEIAKSSQLDLFRRAEGQLGTSNLPDLNLTPLGDVTGSIPQNEQSDIISGVRNLLF